MLCYESTLNKLLLKVGNGGEASHKREVNLLYKIAQIKESYRD